MDEGKEREILESLYELDNPDLFIEVMNYYGKVKKIRSNMVDCLNLLDSVAEDGNKKDKKRLRKIILDNYNDLPRESCKLIKELTNILGSD